MSAEIGYREAGGEFKGMLHRKFITYLVKGEAPHEPANTG